MNYSIFELTNSVKSGQRFFAVLAILALVFGPLSNVQPALAADIFNFGFEAAEGNLSGWTNTGWSSANDADHTGSKSAKLVGANNTQVLSRTISTVGFTNPSISFWYKAESLESWEGDKVEVDYTLDGSTWTEFNQIDDGEDDGQWRQVTFSVAGTGDDNNANFGIRFDGELSNGNDKVWVDDVKITGTDIPVVVPCEAPYTGNQPNCVPPPCEQGWTGTYPNCVPPVIPCEAPYTGNQPNCVPPPCPQDYTGTYPNCVPPVIPCTEPYTGNQPNCVPPPCPEGTEGTYPECVDIVVPCEAPYTGNQPNCVPPPCEDGWTGTYPNCVPPVIPCTEPYTGNQPNCVPPPCENGWTGTYPNCVPPVVEVCPEGYTGTYPNCIPPVVDECSVTVVSDNTDTVTEKAGAVAKILSTVNGAWDTITGASWIWGDDPVNAPTTVDETQTFTKTFTWNASVASITNAELEFAADNGFKIMLNGDEVDNELSEEFNYGLTETFDVQSFIQEGENTLVITVVNMAEPGSNPATNPAGLIYKLVVEGTDEDCDEEPTPTGTLQITKYSCPADTVVTRSQNGVGKTVPEGCVPDAGETFGYVHGTQTDANAPYPELSETLTHFGTTGVDGIVSLELEATGRYLIVETNDANEKLPNNEILGLYCTGDGDQSDNNDNQELTFISDDQVTQCVAYNPSDEVAIPQCLVAEENLLLNPSFEEPVIEGDWTILAAVANWVISSDGLELWNNFMGGASHGEQNAELDGNQSTNISQTVATIPGNEYKVTFDFSPRMNVADNEVEVVVDGVSLGTIAADGTGNAGNEWENHYFTFIATDDSTVVEFKDLSTSDSYGTLIDNTGLCMTDDNRDGGGNGDDEYTLTITTSGPGEGNVKSTGEDNGIACYTEGGEGNDCSEIYEEGTVVTLEVTPDAGSNFDSSWSTILGDAGTCVDNATSCQITMNGNVSLDAHFALNGDSSSNGGGGGGGSRISLSRDNDDDEDPTPQVLGEATSIIPAGAPNTGFGGTSSTNDTIATVFGLLAMIFAFGTMKVTKDVK